MLTKLAVGRSATGFFIARCQALTIFKVAAEQLINEQLASTASGTAGAKLVIMTDSWLEQLEQLVFVKPTGLHNNFTFSLWQKLYL